MRKVKRILGMMVMTLGLGACSGCSHMDQEKGDERPFETPLPVNVKPKRMAIGHTVVAAVKADGTVWTWGQAFEGEMGLGQANSSSTVPVRIPGLTEFVEVAGMDNHFLARRKDGSVWSWGQNDKGKLGYDTTPDKWIRDYSATPTKIEGLENIVSIAVGGEHSVALSATGDVFSWGSNEWGSVDPTLSREEIIRRPHKVTNFKEAVRVVADSGYTGVITKGGDLYLWGWNVQGRLLTDKAGLKEVPKYPDYQDIADFSSALASYLLVRDGKVISSGENGAGMLGVGDRKEHIGINQVHNIGKIKSIANDGSGGVALDEKGRVWQWGPSVLKPPTELSRTDALAPISMASFENVVDVYAGRSVVAILLDDGSVYMWGSGKSGKLGNGEANVEYRYWADPTKTLWTWK